MRRDIGEVYVQMFDVALANWYGEPPGLCVHSETCGLALALEHTGDVYSCDHFVEPAFQLGNIRENRMIDLIVLPQQQAFGHAKRDTLPRFCLELRRAVRLPRRMPEGPLHDDPRRRPRAALPVPELQGVLPPHRPAMRAMCDLLRANRAPSELVAGMRPRTRGGAATTPAPAGRAASGSTATCCRRAAAAAGAAAPATPVP